MCLHGVYKEVVILSNLKQSKRVLVDACIADEIQWLNDNGVITLNSCCGHGNAGIPIYTNNKTEKIKEYQSPPIVLISKQSIAVAKNLEYKPFPYHGVNDDLDTWQMFLKSGCTTVEECKEWHFQHAIPYTSELGIISN